MTTGTNADPSPSDIPVGEASRNCIALGVNGLATHYVELDRLTGGLQPSELVIIAGNRSMGKTALALSIALNAVTRDDKAVAIFTLEMTREKVIHRLVSGLALVPVRNMQAGMLFKGDREKLVAAVDQVLNSKLFIDDSAAMTLQYIRKQVLDRHNNRTPLDLVIIDYLQLLTGSAAEYGKSAEYRVQELSEISRGLKALAKEIKVPIVALSQLSRATERRDGNKTPLLGDLRDSGSIENDADVVCFIHREEFYDPDDENLHGKARLIVAKQRNGPTGIVDLAWLSAYTRFENLAVEKAATGGVIGRGSMLST